MNSSSTKLYISSLTIGGKRAERKTVDDSNTTDSLDRINERMRRCGRRAHSMAVARDSKV